MKKLGRFCLSLILFAGIAGCASASKTKKGLPLTGASIAVPPGSQAGPQVYGPPVPTSAPTQPLEKTFGPEPVKLRPIVLVLGPGLARGFSYVGVFRALSEHKIPIAAILGTEMGALMGALYGVNGNLNQFEWGLVKLKDEIFERPGNLFLNLVAGDAHQYHGDSAQLDQVLRKIFRGRELEASRIPVKIAIRQKGENATYVVSTGPVASVVRSAMGVPGEFTPGQWLFNGKQEWVAATETKPLLIAEARELAIGPVVAIALDENAEASLKLEDLSLADLVIRPNMAGIGPSDFKKRNEAALKGKHAIVQNLAEIRKLVGL